MNRIVKKNSDVEVSTLLPGTAAKLEAFNVTKQRIADRANERTFSAEWEEPKAYSTWHRALDGKKVWVDIVDALEALYEDQVKHPRKYLPDNGPPDDDEMLAAWMKQIAGAKWWHAALRLTSKENTLTGWMAGRPMSRENVSSVRERLRDWWERVDAACAQCDMKTAYYAIKNHERDVASGTMWEEYGSTPQPFSFASYFYTYVHEDGHSVDEARDHWVLMNELAYEAWVDLIDLSNPQPVEIVYWSANIKSEVSSLSVAQRIERNRAHSRDEFDEMWARGLDLAMPRDMPEGTDLSEYIVEDQWKDRRFEEGQWDENEGLYKLYYRARWSRRWCRETRRVDLDFVEVFEVSEDGHAWRAPTERQRKGWYHPAVENALYREQHYGESPTNQYYTAVEEARSKVKQARDETDSRSSRVPIEQREAALNRAYEELDRALKDY